MPIVWVLLVPVALLLLILTVPTVVRCQYDRDLRLWVRVLGIPIPLLPPPGRKKKEPESGTDKEKGKKRSLLRELWTYFRQDGAQATLELLQKVAAVTARAAGRLLSAVTVSRFRLSWLVAADTPDKTAVRYGEVCSVAFPALTAVKSRVRVKRQEVRIEPNFLIGKSEVAWEVSCRFVPIRILWIILALWKDYQHIEEQTIDPKKEEQDHGKQ